MITVTIIEIKIVALVVAGMPTSLVVMVVASQMAVTTIMIVEVGAATTSRVGIKGCMW